MGMALLMTHTHGGDVEAVAREYSVPATELIDFSASINPFGPPRTVIERLQRDSADSSLLARYPDPKYSELRSALAASLRVPPDCLVVANGSAALVGAAIRAFAVRTCLLAVPAFGEQQDALDAAGCTVVRFPLRPAAGFRLDIDTLCEAIARIRPALCVLTNPHNPSGVLTTAAEMSQVVRTASASRVQLLIDEAFIDFAPSETMTADATETDHLVVLRSLTKFYGMPALRVGYAVSTPGMVARIDRQLPAWPVATLAATAAVAALRDDDYARRTLGTVANDRQQLRERMVCVGIETYPSAANFLLLRLPARGPDSTRLRTKLIRTHHIIVRDCRSFDGLADGRFIRVAVRSRVDNERLVEAIHAVLGEMPGAD
jgi:threonine-phosphate decarboxylase